MPQATSRTVLLVEDDEFDRRFARDILASTCEDCEIVTLADGQEMLEWVDEHGLHEVGFVLLDLKMPRMGGLRALEELRRRGLVDVAPIIIMSSSNLVSDIKRAYELGAVAYLTKPINHLEYREAVQGLGVFWTKYNTPRSYVLDAGERP